METKERSFAPLVNQMAHRKRFRRTVIALAVVETLSTATTEVLAQHNLAPLKLAG